MWLERPELRIWKRTVVWLNDMGVRGRETWWLPVTEAPSLTTGNVYSA